MTVAGLVPLAWVPRPESIKKEARQLMHNVAGPYSQFAYSVSPMYNGTSLGSFFDATPLAGAPRLRAQCPFDVAKTNAGDPELVLSTSSFFPK